MNFVVWRGRTQASWGKLTKRPFLNRYIVHQHNEPRPPQFWSNFLSRLVEKGLTPTETNGGNYSLISWFAREFHRLLILRVVKWISKMCSGLSILEYRVVASSQKSWKIRRSINKKFSERRAAESRKRWRRTTRNSSRIKSHFDKTQASKFNWCFCN